MRRGCVVSGECSQLAARAPRGGGGWRVCSASTEGREVLGAGGVRSLLLPRTTLHHKPFLGTTSL